ncbi:GntR family transcriptional regulator [Rhodococcus sp. WS3]|uniref:GntR family transcriptional regulator n=1 Tax=unclassified Rhodococcus (in: high G+C Gram-positive bacteria) TaxID=192944 RepID=UPI0005D2E9CA|nr:MULTISPECIES: GntR family transcriptional regulator [unclassified Rhodococcus (in: high G+C Gram-positive bacteria)]KJF19297.1 HTH-type transcriptional repressor yvoA [Rhodococcus sp. AD45]ROZ42747.1 GntR family transcriptional regulator [Rhodococcus sp. WS3]RZL21766.1 MAG: GntR family transcriptional regulator [Rhodococcus sp. (in: high G+C Gram-positive bacteria)]
MAWDDEDLVVGAIPLWFQISERLVTALDKGEFTVGDALPSEAELNRRFEVSRTTARAALDHLETQGLIERRSGRGSIVLPPRVDQSLQRMSSFAEDMHARGWIPGYAEPNASIVRASGDVATVLNIDRSTRVVFFSRLLLANSEPIGVSESWLSPAAVPARKSEMTRVTEATSLYTWLETERGFRVSSGTEVIEAGIAGEMLSERLRIDIGAPVLIARRIAFDADGVPIEYVCRHYRADRYRYRTELQRR